MTALDVDVAIVGYGPVGQATAALLARRGHRVAAYERFGEIYRLPRAVYFDDEIMQVWQSLGIADELADDLLPAETYNWFGADGELILKMEFPSPGLSGWHWGYTFFQPNLEAVLDRAVRAQPSAAVHRGWGAEALTQADDHVALTLRRVREPECGGLEPTPETSDRAGPLRGRRGRRELVRAQRLRHRL